MPGRKTIFAVIVTSFLTTIRLAADCSSAVVVSVPPSACKSGTATAAIAGNPDATYTWTVDGGQITGEGTGDHIDIALGTNATATVSVTMTAGGCVSSGSGVIALHDPFIVKVNAIPAANASEPLTIIWAYENGAPAQQTISGGDFGSLTLPADARSYTYTPRTSGSEQFVIDAAMVVPSNIPPPASRRRSVAKTPATASICTSAHAAASYTVGLCVTPPVVIKAPDAVVTGSTFPLTVRSQPGAVATWTITNGSPATATGENVTVTAGSSGTVDISVQLTRGACTGQLGRSIAITAKAVCNNPKATVSAGPISCGSAVVNASLTGTPPFQGMWSDGLPFSTSAMALARMVTTPGNYSIVSFEDAGCTGTSSGVAVLTALGPTATIPWKANSCLDVGQVTVQFTGKPPFSGQWLDGTTFQTNDMQIVKTITTTGPDILVEGHDATGCPLVIIGSLQVIPAPKVEAMTFCLSPDFGNVVSVYANFDGAYTAPLTVNWSDGVTTTSIGNPVYRPALPPPQQTTTYTIVSAHDANCSAIVGPASVTVYASTVPDFDLGYANICTGLTASASLSTPPPADATVSWFVENGAVVSGQGTSSIQFKAGDVGSMIVGCTFTYPGDRCPVSKRLALEVNEVDPVVTLSLPSPTIHAGDTVVVTYTVDDNVHFWSLDDSLSDNVTLQGGCNRNEPCQAVYTSTHGQGRSTITLHATGFCQTRDVSAVLTILP